MFALLFWSAQKYKILSDNWYIYVPMTALAITYSSVKGYIFIANLYFCLIYPYVSYSFYLVLLVELPHVLKRCLVDPSRVVLTSQSDDVLIGPSRKCVPTFEVYRAKTFINNIAPPNFGGIHNNILNRFFPYTEDTVFLDHHEIDRLYTKLLEGIPLPPIHVVFRSGSPCMYHIIAGFEIYYLCSILGHPTVLIQLSEERLVSQSSVASSSPKFSTFWFAFAYCVALFDAPKLYSQCDDSIPYSYSQSKHVRSRTSKARPPKLSHFSDRPLSKRRIRKTLTSLSKHDRKELFGPDDKKSKKLIAKNVCPKLISQSDGLCLETLMSVMELNMRKFGLKTAYSKSDVADLIYVIYNIVYRNTDLKSLCLDIGIGLSKITNCRIDPHQYSLEMLKLVCGEDELVSQADMSTILDGIKSALRNWQDYRHSDTVKRLHQCVCYTLALLGKESFVVGTDVFRLYSAQAMSHINVTSFSTYIMESIVFFIERGQHILRTGNPYDLFYSEDSDYEFAKEYVFLTTGFPLLESGNLEIDETEFETRLHKAISKCEDIIKFTKDKHYAPLKLAKLQDVRTKLVHSQQNSGLRVKPFSLLLYGESGVSKSQLCNLLTCAILKANNFGHKKENIICLNPDDKYQSEYRSHHSAVIMDDLCNAKLAVGSSSPLAPVITYANNMQTAALSPIAELKGNIMIRPKVFMSTTNVKNLNAPLYSNEPVSIQRRFEFTITVRIRPEYTDGKSHMVNRAKVAGQMVPDMWELDVEEVIPVKLSTGATVGEYRIAKHGNTPLQNVSLGIALEYLVAQSRVHFDQQKKYVASSDDLYECKMCPHDNYPEICPKCLEEKVVADVLPDDDNLDSQSSTTESVLGMVQIYTYISIISWFISTMSYSYQLICHESAIKILYKYPMVRRLILRLFSKRYTKYLCYISLAIPLCAVLFFTLTGSPVLCWYSFYLFSLLLSLIELCVYLVRQHVFKRCDLELQPIRNIGAKFRKTLYSDGVKALGACGAVLLCCHLLYKLYSFTSQSNTMDQLFSVIPASANERVNIWKERPKANAQGFPTSGRAINTSTSQLRGVVSKKVAHATMISASVPVSRCNAFPIKGNLWVFPKHAVPHDEFSVKLVRNVGAGSKLQCKSVGQNCVWRHPFYDFAIVYLYGVPPDKDLSEYLPNEYLAQNCGATMFYKNVDADLIETDLPCKVSTDVYRASKGRFKGFSYPHDNTFKGLCGAPLVSDTRAPTIIGFHLAGSETSKLGCSGTLLKSDLKDAEKFLFKDGPHVQLASEGEFRTTRYGIKIDIKPEVHRKCPANFMAEECSFYHYGSHPQRRTFRSDVVKTIISNSVTKHCHQPPMHGPPPNMNSWEHWHTDFSKKANCNAAFNSEILHAAYTDFGTQIMEELITQQSSDQDVKPKDIITPITLDHAICGIDGVYGVDRINLSSSMGFPVCKPKKDYFSPSERKIEKVTDPLDCPQFVLDEIDTMKSAYLRGERAYAIQRANLKDTPTKLGKKKVRVFAGCDTAFLLLVRQYFVWVCKLTMENATTFECAVGTNCYGPAWTQLVNHMNKYGRERVIAGDYAGFDGTMSSEIMLKAFKIIISMAEWSGNFNEDSLKIMRGIATDICFPLYEFNGDIIQFFGSNPSGQPLTVIINNFCNSLYLRYAYYAIYTNPVCRFNEVVSVMCYGDDNKMSVKEGYSDYNHTRVAEELLKVGVVYTMADKESESVPYIHSDEATFLKRGELWCANGPLCCPIGRSIDF
jgi:hypothetical protein